MPIKETPESKKYLNVGCGGSFSAEWNNVDCYVDPANVKDVLYYDIREPLPYPDNSFDAVYCSHLIEHLTPKKGGELVAEIHRVLARSGICRIVCPDLEDTCNQYLKQLHECLEDPSPKNIQRYNWMKIELLDQMVREKSGGLMLEVLQNNAIDEEFVRNRCGDQYAGFFDKSTAKDAPVGKLKMLIDTLLAKGPIKTLHAIFGSRDPRITGEAHKWMYDRLSLKLLVEKCGFKDFAQKQFNESDIPYWEKYNLDKSPSSDAPRIQDSIYIECKKI